MSLYEELKKFRSKDRVSFHIPGHKFGAGLSKGFKKDIFITDVTEFDETDDLQNPQGILKTAQESAAKVFKAHKTFYLTSGSSLGLQGAIFGSFRSGDKVLVDRTCHKAVASSMVMAGLIPVFVQPEFSQEKGLYVGMTVKIIKKAIEETPDIKGVIITSPTYYGVCSDIKGIGEYLHQKNKVLIVDEAHGAHFVFNKLVPESAIEQGADISIESAHKTLPAMGQCSFLHISKNSLVPWENISKSLRLLQTTSPSYVLMTSLDEAVIYMSTKGTKRINKLISQIDKLKKEVRAKGVLDFADKKTLKRPQDELRLSVDFKKSGISGNAATQIIKEQFGIYPEMADDRYVVFVVTCSNSDKDIRFLKEALLTFEAGDENREQCEKLPDVIMVMEPRMAWQCETEDIPISKAAARVAADVVAVCPPGAALLVPGQFIDTKTVDYIEKAGIIEKVTVVKNI